MSVPSMHTDICGLILCGGKSSRMGFDKGSIAYHGKPQLEYLFELLKPCCHEVFISCKPTMSVPVNMSALFDQHKFESPLNGIITAFEKDHSKAWLTVPVDMPYIDADTISLLLDNRDKTAYATCFYDSDGTKPEPLVAIWEPMAYPLLNAFFEEGNVSPRKFLMNIRVNLVRHHNPKFNVNVNNPEELARFRNGL